MQAVRQVVGGAEHGHFEASRPMGERRPRREADESEPGGQLAPGARRPHCAAAGWTVGRGAGTCAACAVATTAFRTPPMNSPRPNPPTTSRGLWAPTYTRAR